MCNLQTHVAAGDAHAAAGAQLSLETIHVVRVCMPKQRVVYRLMDTLFFQSAFQPWSRWKNNPNKSIQAQA